MQKTSQRPLQKKRKKKREGKREQVQVYATFVSREFKAGLSLYPIVNGGTHIHTNRISSDKDGCVIVQ